jgi:hypothetical protein
MSSGFELVITDPGSMSSRLFRFLGYPCDADHPYLWPDVFKDQGIYDNGWGQLVSEETGEVAGFNQGTVPTQKEFQLLACKVCIRRPFVPSHKDYMNWDGIPEDFDSVVRN